MEFNKEALHAYTEQCFKTKMLRDNEEYVKKIMEAAEQGYYDVELPITPSTIKFIEWLSTACNFTLHGYSSTNKDSSYCVMLNTSQLYVMDWDTIIVSWR